MISSKTLKTFVKMHEYKLNAKINQQRTKELDSELEEVHWGADCLDGRQQQSQTVGHWRTNVSGLASNVASGLAPSRHRPKSRYFNFILTATHR